MNTQFPFVNSANPGGATTFCLDGKDPEKMVLCTSFTEKYYLQRSALLKQAPSSLGEQLARLEAEMNISPRR
jgi:hypothetical protein